MPEDFQKLSVDTEIKASDDALENEEGDDQLETEAQPGQSQAPQEQRELQLTEQQLGLFHFRFDVAHNVQCCRRKEQTGVGGR